MEYNELRDIMLEKEEDKKSKGAKKILILIAAFTIIFLAVLIVMKILNTNDSLDNIAQPDSRLVLPPEPDTAKQNPPQVVAQNNTQPATQQTSPQTNKVADSQQNDALFQQVPILPENKGQDSFEDMVKTLKEKEAKSKQEQNNPNVNQQNNVAVTPKAPETPKVETKHVVEPKKQEPKVVVTQPKESVKPQTQKPATNATAAKPKESQNTNAKFQNLASGSYIQVFAVKNFNENATEIKKLKAGGYSYKLYEADVKGSKIIKVLVGPYSGQELATELPKVKKNISSGAFIVNIK